MRTRPAASLHQGSTVEGVVGTTVTCVMSSKTEMLVVGSKTGVGNESAWNRNSVMKGTLITRVPTMTNLTGSAPLKEAIIQEESKLSPTI
jgi:hypothetical protein